MLQFLTFILALGSTLYWLSLKTALPDAKPLNTSDLTALLQERELRSGLESAKDHNVSTPSLNQVFAFAARRLEAEHSGASPLHEKLISFSLDGLSPELREAVRELRPDIASISELVLRDIQALPNDRLDTRADERQRLLKLSLVVTEAPEESVAASAPNWVSIGLRQLEIPTEPDARDTLELELIQDAATLVRRFTPDSGRRSSLLRQIEPLHPSSSYRGELQRILQDTQ